MAMKPRTLPNLAYQYSLKEVAAALGITYEYARQIEERALMKCRAILEHNGISFADLIEADPAWRGIVAPNQFEFDEPRRRVSPPRRTVTPNKQG